MKRARSSEIAARLTRLAVVYLPPRRRGIRLTHLAEGLFGTPTYPLRARHVSGYRITCDLRDSVQRSLFYCGTYEPQTTALIASELRPGDTFLDIGANVGHYTFTAARLVGASGRVVAVEASASTASRLDEDVKQNRLTKTVSVHNVAASDRESRVALYSTDDPSQAGMRHLDPSGEGTFVEYVHTLPLDELLREITPAVVKLDIEGAELRALTGMQQMLTAHPPRLIVAETQEQMLNRFGDSVEALIIYLEQAGYRHEAIGEQWHSDSRAFRLREP